MPDLHPPVLSKRDLQHLRGAIHDAEAALHQLNLADDKIPSINWFTSSLVRKETLVRSQIEGTQATLGDMPGYEQTGHADSSDIADIVEVTNYLKAINYALDDLGTTQS